MISGLIFDLGSTLLYNDNPSTLRPRMIADLLVDLKAQGLTVDEKKFSDAYIRNIEDFDQQRQTHFKEITTEYIFRITFEQLNLDINAINLPRALTAFFAFSETKWRLMPHVHNTLRQLKEHGYKMAIISNASDNDNVQRLIDNAQLRSYFDLILVSAAVGIRKPNPRIFEPVINAWNIPPNKIVMIGDTLGADILGAKHTNMKSIWVTMQADTPYNQAHRETITPDAICDSLDKLPLIIETLKDGS